MRKVVKLLLTLIISMSLLVGCSNNQVKNNQKLYEGKELNIGVVGEIPQVREDNVKFIQIEISDLEKENLNTNYDAIFINRDYHSQVAEAKYVQIYMDTKIPFFFIESKKAIVGFALEEISYDQAPDYLNNEFACGLMFVNNDEYKSWDYGLYNNTYNEDNVKEAYSRIFQTISEINNI